MCGICGYIAGDPIQGGAEIVDKMVESLAHRGPDHRGRIVDDTVAMGFARLSIIDLSVRSNQPMASACGGYLLTFNGEVFNYLELRDDLEKLGAVFETTSDTEVVLKAYMQWGADCFSRFRGMWALAIWDKNLDRLVFSRDPFGIKPLYFFKRSGALYWASEIKAFQALDGALCENARASLDYLEYGLQDHTEETFFKDVWQLRPGQAAVVTPDLKIQKYHYWNLAESLWRNVPADEASQIDLFRSALFESVDISLRSDVPVWILLSGGLDSSSIVSIVRHLYPKREINTISVVHDDPSINEFPYVRAVAEHTGCKVEQVKIGTDDWILDLEDLVYHQDEPPPSTTAVNHWFLMKELNKLGIKVILSGQGVDEILYGYVGILMGHYFWDLAKDFEWPLLGREVIAHFLGREKNLGQGAIRFLMQAAKGAVPQSWAKRFKAAAMERASSMLDLGAAGARNEYSPPRLESLDRLHNAFYRMLTVESIPRILHYEDRSSMAFSIEQRVPFLDDRLVSYVFSLPSRMKVRDGQSKWILREALKGILNEDVRGRRTKLGFNAPEGEWLKSGEFQGWVRDKGIMEGLKSSVVDAKRFDKRMEAFVSGRAKYSPLYWRVYSYAMWKKRFNL